MLFTYDIKNELTYDVAVIGGGTAGVFAAISAARTGAKTVLIEKNNILGGTMTVANVCFPGLFFAWGKRIIGGPCWEAIERTASLGGAVIPEVPFKPLHHWDVQIDLNRYIFTTVLFQMCDEAGVDVKCSSMVSYAKENEDGVDVIITCKDGMHHIKAGAAIDASGDANLCSIMGYDLLKSEKQQPATLSNRITGYELTDEIIEEVRRAIPLTKFPDYIEPFHILHYLKIGKIDMHIPCRDADTSEGKTALEKRALYDILHMYKFYRSIKGLENLSVCFTAQETGVRETNRVLGETVISADDYINGVFYSDSVCYAFYPIDLHVMNGIEQKFHEENVVSKVPYSALVPKGAKRVFCAGRCISSDTYANSALRVEAVCMATGQVTGVAAAMCAQSGIQALRLDYTKLCDGLEKIGAIVPEK